MRRARWKRKSVCSKLAHRCKFGGNGFCENCCAGEELRTKSRAGCRACPALYAVLIVASNLRVQIGHPLLLFPLPLPIPKRGFQRRGPSPSPKKGFQRGGPQPAPLCRFKGVRGEIEIPPRFSLGGRGDILFSKENIPLASPYRNGTVPPGTPVIFSARRKENGDSIRCGIAAHLRTNLVRLISQKKSSAFCGGNRPPAGARTR